MESKEDIYKKTVELYEKLGKKYIEGIAGAVIRELPDFIILLPRGGKVLDVGCAGGRDSKKLVEAGFEVTGIDLVNVFLEEARKNVPQAKFIKMDLLELEFPGNYFDGIWAEAVLLHLKKEDIPRALKGFYRILRPKGKLYIDVKRGSGEKYKGERLSGGEKRFFSYFLKNEFEKFVKDADFRIVFSKILPDSLGRKDVKWIGIWAEKNDKNII